ncbi:MAG TPA: hypothetical protein VFD92_28305 [Candidatus Binatia bacterium]|nr:hypothetical protein [Candidatus Binatia bacterium]
MPIHNTPDCPGCGQPLVRKPAGRCPHCGAEVAAYVAAERDRETRIEKVVAVISTFLVVTVLVVGGGLGAIEGVAMYAAAGAFVWYLAKGTFATRGSLPSDFRTRGSLPSPRSAKPNGAPLPAGSLRSAGGRRPAERDGSHCVNDATRGGGHSRS